MRKLKMGERWVWDFWGARTELLMGGSYTNSPILLHEGRQEREEGRPTDKAVFASLATFV